MTATTIEQIEQWMATPHEYENLEFKEAGRQYDNTKLFKYCVALANEGGGKFILGVSDAFPRKVCGSSAFREPAGMQTKILDTLGFRVSIEEVNHPDGRIVIFHIPPRPHGTAYHYEGAYFMRSNSSLVPMTEDRLRQIFDEGKPNWLMRLAREGCSEADVVQMLDTHSYFELLNLPYPSNRAAVLERFEKEKLIQQDWGDYAITNLGAILFAKRLDEFEGLERKTPRVLAYDGPNKLANTRLVKLGVKGYATSFSGLVEFINAQTPTNEVFGKAIRREVQMYPPIAIRELVANALIHQDFSETGTSVTIDLYSDRIEISNPGIPIISPERFIDEYQSRNEKLADLMRRLGICEEQGKGIDKTIAFAEVYQLPPLDFRVSERRTIVVMFAYKPFEKMDGKERVRACFQHCVLRWLMNEKMTNTTLRERFQLPESKSETVSRIIADAIQDRRIKPDDPANTSRRYAKYVPYWV
jgi:ATP-dependent DNA helicase RecG